MIGGGNINGDLYRSIENDPFPNGYQRRRLRGENPAITAVPALRGHHKAYNGGR